VSLPSIRKFCSHCSNNTNHTLYQRRILSRDEYNCSSCDGKTQTCMTCQDGMAKFGQLRCSVCNPTQMDMNEIAELLDDQTKTPTPDNSVYCVRLCSWCNIQTKHNLLHKQVDKPFFNNKQKNRKKKKCLYFYILFQTHQFFFFFPTLLRFLEEMIMNVDIVNIQLSSAVGVQLEWQ
jgi:hypothetical protein